MIRLISALAIVVPILVLTLILQFGAPRILEHLPGALAIPLLALAALAYVSMLAATIEMLVRIARGTAPAGSVDRLPGG